LNAYRDKEMYRNTGKYRVGWGYIKRTNQHVFRVGIGNNPRFHPGTSLFGYQYHFHINLIKTGATF